MSYPWLSQTSPFSFPCSLSFPLINAISLLPPPPLLLSPLPPLTRGQLAAAAVCRTGKYCKYWKVQILQRQSAGPPAANTPTFPIHHRTLLSSPIPLMIIILLKNIFSFLDEKDIFTLIRTIFNTLMKIIVITRWNFNLLGQDWIVSQNTVFRCSQPGTMKNYENPPGNMKTHPEQWKTMKNNLEPWKSMKTDLELWKTNLEPRKPWKTNLDQWKTMKTNLEPWKPIWNH